MKYTALLVSIAFFLNPFSLFAESTSTHVEVSSNSSSSVKVESHSTSGGTSTTFQATSTGEKVESRSKDGASVETTTTSHDISLELNADDPKDSDTEVYLKINDANGEGLEQSFTTAGPIDIEIIAEDGTISGHVNKTDLVYSISGSTDTIPEGFFDISIQSNEGTEADGDTSKVITVTKTEVRGWNPEKKEGILGSVKRAVEEQGISSLEDLYLHLATITHELEPIESIAFTPENIRVDYVAKGRLLGIIPVKLKQHIETVITDPESVSHIKTKSPWWSFLVTGKTIRSRDLRAELAAEDSDRDDENTSQIQRTALMIDSVTNSIKITHDAAMNSIRNFK